MMKKSLVICLLLMLTVSAGQGAIVNNSITSPTSEDSLSFLLNSLDSLGNPTLTDSILLLVIGPDGSIAFADSFTVSDGRVTATTVRNRVFYSFTDQVSNLDGGGAEGSYSLTLLALNDSLALSTPNRYSFQIIAEELSDRLALIGDSVIVKSGAVDSNRTERGSSFDSSDVAGFVWNAPQSNHVATGTFGRYLDAPISGISSGSGVYSYDLLTFDSSLGQVIPSVDLAVRNLDQSSLIAVSRTDTGGRTTINLDSDSFYVVAAAPSYIFDAPDTIIVSGAGVDTLFGYRFDPGSPSLPVFCRVYGYTYLSDGTPETGAVVSAGLPEGVTRWDNIIVSPFDVTTTTDSIGYFYLDLIPSDSLVPPTTPYEISIFRKNGSILRKKLTVPATTSWRLQW